MGLAIPESDDIKKLIDIESQRLEIEQFIAGLLGAKPKAFFSSISFRGVVVKGEIKHMELKEGQQVTATVSLTTKAGHPAAYQTGSAKWTSSDPAVTATVDPNNELSAVIAGIDGSANAAALITFTADGDPNADVERDVVATLDVVCTQGDAVVASMTTDAPVATP